MVDEHATLEVAFQETVVGELCGVEIADVELFRPAQQTAVLSETQLGL